MWKPSLGLIPSLLLSCALSVHAANFTFSYGDASQCDPFQISWQGGVAPYTLTLFPSYGSPRTFSIPDADYKNNKGTYSTQLDIAKGQNIIAVMSDAGGFGTGGVSPIITVGSSTSNKNCNTTDPGVDFYYDTNSALSQCIPYVFNGYGKAVLPITIKGLVPGGEAFYVYTGSATTVNWVVDIAAGTDVAFVMEDSKGRQGGTSDFLPVGQSDVTTCLNKNSPSSVAGAPSMTSSQAPAKTSSGSDSGTSDPSNTSNAGTVAAAIVGTIVALVVVGSLIWFYLRRRNSGKSLGGVFGRRFQKQEVDLMKSDAGLPPSSSLNPYPLYSNYHNSSDLPTPNSSIHLLRNNEADPSAYGAEGAYHRDSTVVFAPQPPHSATSTHFPPSAPSESARGASQHGGAYDRASQFGMVPVGFRPEGSVGSWDRDQSVTSSAARRKAAQAGVSTYQAPARFILHTDIEDLPPPLQEEEVIELPPQYSERHTPLASSSAAPASRDQATPSPRLAYMDGEQSPFDDHAGSRLS